MHYHRALEGELEEVAGEFFDTPSIWRARLHNGMRGRLIADNEEAVLPEPVPVHILGSERVDLWLDVALRDTIERAWHREDRYFGRTVREG